MYTFVYGFSETILDKTKGNTNVRNKLVTPERKRWNSFVDRIEVAKKGRERVERREDSKNKT